MRQIDHFLSIETKHLRQEAFALRETQTDDKFIGGKTAALWFYRLLVTAKHLLASVLNTAASPN
ncbi:hypothetical protein LOC67_14540 [Stieleria sp. JC731]|uniref:hypothetical protein n=1 Tax=Stieleria sp. JC731 TaxID=2894195 RepID=UPI001E5CF22F|nr:hypothetical protein [Stieleria sp. JC731]MCC9601775.1 hypothetical protein [Stieleria sp. JC731]